MIQASRNWQLVPETENMRSVFRWQLRAPQQLVGRPPVRIHSREPLNPVVVCECWPERAPAVKCLRVFKNLALSEMYLVPGFTQNTFQTSGSK
jgi:hypothetical protein